MLKKEFLKLILSFTILTTHIQIYKIVSSQELNNNEYAYLSSSGYYVPELYKHNLGKYKPDYRGLYKHIVVPYNGGYGDRGIKYKHVEPPQQAHIYYKIDNKNKNSETDEQILADLIKKIKLPEFSSKDHLRVAIDFNFNKSDWQIVNFDWLRDEDDDEITDGKSTKLSLKSEKRLWSTDNKIDTNTESIERNKILGSNIDSGLGKADDFDVSERKVDNVKEAAVAAVDNAQPAAENAKSTADYAQPVAENAQPAADYAQPVAENAQPAAVNAQPAAYYAQPAADYAQPAADYAQAAADYAHPAADYAQNVQPALSAFKSLEKNTKIISESTLENKTNNKPTAADILSDRKDFEKENYFKRMENLIQEKPTTEDEKLENISNLENITKDLSKIEPSISFGVYTIPNYINERKNWTNSFSLVNTAKSLEEEQETTNQANDGFTKTNEKSNFDNSFMKAKVGPKSDSNDNDFEIIKQRIVEI